MAKTVLVSSIDKSTTYPVSVSVSADKCKGAIIVVFDESYTEQMFYELPSITIEIYVDCDGDKVLYLSRGIGLQTGDSGKFFATYLSGIPTSCYFNIIPNFDKGALDAHNQAVLTGRVVPFPCPDETIEEQLWKTPTTTFPIKLVWDDFN